MNRRIAAALLASLVAVAVAGAQQIRRVEPAAMEARFPTATYPNVNPAAGIESVNLADYVGRRPFVLYYWIPGNPRADLVLDELRALIDEVGGTGKLPLLAVTLPKPGLEEEVIAKRAAERGLEVPILADGEFRLGQQLRVQSVPNITLVDRGGLLRLTNGASLRQTIGYKLTVESAIRRLAEKGEVGTYGYLDRYFPVEELVGEKAPDFKAPLISNSVEQRWSSLIQKGKVNLLVFWSVDCPHCTKTLPELNRWFKTDGEGFNVVSTAFVKNDANRTKTKEFCEVNGFAFPTLVDDGQEVGALYNVTSTPTILVVTGDGVVDSVLLNADETFPRRMREIRERLF